MEKRNCFLDCVKFFAAIFIVFHHYQQITGAHFDGIINFWGGNFFWGLMVEFFFVISGLLTVKYIEKIKDGLKFHTFYLYKARRLLPLVALSAVVYEIIVLLNIKAGGEFSWFSAQSINLWGTFIDSMGVQAGWVFDNPHVNNPTWYCSVLLLCYAVFYILTSISEKSKISPIYFYVCAILLGIAVKTYGWDLPFLNDYSARGYYSFFIGLIIGIVFRDREPSKLISIACFLSIMLTTAGVFLFGSFFFNDYWILFFVFSPIAVISRSHFVNSLFSNRIWQVLSGVSYDIFIWHVVLLGLTSVLIPAMNIDINYKTEVGFILIFTLLVCAFSTLSYYFIEKPLDTLFRRITDKLIIEKNKVRT